MQGLLGCYGSKGWGSLSTGARAGERQLADEPGALLTLTGRLVGAA